MTGLKFVSENCVRDHTELMHEDQIFGNDYAFITVLKRLNQFRRIAGFDPTINRLPYTQGKSHHGTAKESLAKCFRKHSSALF